MYVAAMGSSHPLAKYIGAWPSVAAVTAVTVAAAEVVTRTDDRAYPDVGEHGPGAKFSG